MRRPYFRKRSCECLLIAVVTLLALVGCASNQPLMTPGLQTPVDIMPATETLPATSLPPTVRPPPTHRMPTASDETPLIASNPTAEVEEQCLDPQLDPAKATDLAVGLVSTGTWDGANGIGILGSEGWARPRLVILELSPSQAILPFVSPNGEWLAYSQLRGSGESYALDLTALKLAEQLSTTTTLDALTLSRTTFESWANDRQFAVPLAEDNGKFSWMIWTPESNQLESVSIELPDRGRAERFDDLAPQYDPTLQLVVYACESCGNDEYRVRDLATGKLLWSIDLGVEAGFRTPPAWSPNGQYLAITGARDFTPDGLWILDRDGRIVYAYVLPQGSGIFSAEDLKWSPDSRYLAFSHNVPDPETRVNSTLSLVSIADGAITDYCLDPGDYVWSPDGTKLALSSQTAVNGPARTVTIVVPGDRTAYEFDDPSGHALQGWVSATTP